MKSQTILTHPTANANVRAVAEGLANAGLLHKFYTCVAIFEHNPFFSLTNFPLLQEFRKRTFSNVLAPYTAMRPYKEIGRLAAQKIGWHNLTNQEKGIFCIEKVYQDLDLHTSRKLGEAKIIYAFEDGALQSFREAKKQGVTCIYDLPIGYWRSMRKLLEVERINKPQWAATLKNFHDSLIKLVNKDEEINLADEIFVASSFTAKTLNTFPGKLPPVHVIPYGFPSIEKKRVYKIVSKRKLNVLFVGGLSQRKGISYLFESVQSLKENINLTVVGKKAVENCEILNTNLKQHNWIPALGNSEILKLMRTQDLLLFPSLFEGFGLVVTEAMSQGTPVITTNRTCGPDLITHGYNGWIVEAGSTDALITQLEEILLNPAVLSRTGKAAMETARKRPWEVYGTEISRAVFKIEQKKDHK